MILSICIPTHNGRKADLRDLLESLLPDIRNSGREDEIEICISDNASLDGTEEMVGSYVAAHPRLIRYARLPVNTGIRNFFTVVGMARGEYAWLMGSDDVVLPSGIGRILDCLARNPGLPGLTMNKLNFNHTLTALIGPDHDQVLPVDAARSRSMSGKAEVLGNLFMSFLFISAHVFRKQCWDAVVERDGFERIMKFEHFPHAYIYSEIAMRFGQWYWLADYCVVQRLENFSFWSEVSSRKLDYAEQHTGDLQRIADALFSGEKALHEAFMSRLFVLYWNPVYALRYASDARVGAAELAAARKKCRDWFGAMPLFWLTTYPVLLLPPAISRVVYGTTYAVLSRVNKTPALDPLCTFGYKVFHTLLRWMGVENRTNRSFDAEHEVAQSYLRTRAGLSEPG